MKMKMLILGAAAVAASLCAHALETSTVTFDDLAAGAFDATQAENGKYWWKSANTSNGQIVANDGNYAGDRAVTAGATDNALEIEAEEPLYRGLTGADALASDFGEVSANGVFIDNLIQIGLQSEAPATLPTGVKFAVWGQIVTENSTEVEKLFVRAGKYTEGVLGYFDYEIANLPSGFEFDAWHRVTVKTTVKDGKTFFKFYIDGTLAKTSDETSEFPGLVEATTISAVAYQGNGLVDDIVVTESIPSFAGIAKVGNTYFEDLQAAVNEAISGVGDTLIMLQAVSASAAIVIPAEGEFSVQIPASFPASYDFGAMLTTVEGYEIQQVINNPETVEADGYKDITFTSVESEEPEEEQYDSPDGVNKFAIDPAVATALKTALGVDNLNATVTGKDFTYAQGYALGLVKEDGTIEEAEPVISIKGNKITVGLATMPVNGYTVKFEIIAVGALDGFATVQKGTEYTATGNGETSLTVELDIVESETAKFYKTKIVSISK